jgi:hypothetical protein
VLPASVVGRFAAAADITVRMLLGHPSSKTDYNLLGLIIERITGRF